MVSPALTLAHTGSFAQATTSLSSSLAINEVKKEFVDVKKAAKNVVNQSKDVVDAVKGKKKRGRKPNYKTKTNNSKKRKK